MDLGDSAARVNNSRSTISIQRESAGVRLTLQREQGALTVLLPLAEFDRFLNLGASIFVGVADNAHMAFEALQREPAPTWHAHELN